MTFRQILSVLWHRLWVIAVLVLVAGLAAGYYTTNQTPEYSSTTTLRLSAAATSGQLQQSLGSTEVDLETSAITSTTVLRDAATRLGERPTALEGLVSHSVETGSLRDRIFVTAIGGSEVEASNRADAVAEAYVAYLAAQVDTGRQALQERYDRSIELAESYQELSLADPEDMIAASRFTAELSRASELSSQLETLELDGEPVTVVAAAGDARLLGTPPVAIIGAALAAGLIAGIGLALIIDHLDMRIRSAREVERLADAPLLAELPRDRKAARSREPLQVAVRAPSALNEAIRTLRTSLQVLLPRERPIVVITSVEPGDGKSFVSARLAVAWARAGKQTILVGGDLRRPGLPVYFGEAAEGAGLGELLLDSSGGEAATPEDIDAALCDSGVRNLRILPAGDADADTSDLLALPALEAVLDHLRASADVVVIDAPPSLALPDAALLANHAAGVAVIAAMHRTTRERLTAVIRELSTNGATILGVVANRSRRRLPATYSAYHRAALTAAARPVADPEEDPAESPAPAAPRRGRTPSTQGGTPGAERTSTDARSN